MTDFFEANILEASLGYVTFPVTDRKLGVGRRLSRTEFPYRDGQGVEDLGRKANTYTVSVPLFRGIDESHYPDTYLQLIAVIEDAEQRGSVEFVDPEFGPVQVQIIDYSVESVGTRRDGVMLTLQLEEVGLDQSLLTNLSQPQLAGASRASLFADQADQEVSFIDAPADDKPQFSLGDTWRSFQEALDAGALAADEIAAKLDEVYSVANRFIAFSAVDEIQRWSLFNTVVTFVGAAEDYGNETSENQSTGGKLQEVTLPADMSAYDIATHYYGDAGRADTVIFDNPTSQPMLYPRGAVVRLADDAKTPAQREAGPARQR